MLLGIRPLIFSSFLILILVGVNVIYFLQEDDSIKELTPPPPVQVDSFKQLDEEWKARVEKQRQEEEQGKIDQFWRADIKRELHSMRAQYNIFLKLNHKIEAERREAARQERIRIQKEKAAERKRLQEERAAERKRLKEEKALEKKRLKEEKAAERKQHALDSARKHIQRKGMGKSSSDSE
jgi:colicin import membrane protein